MRITKSNILPVLLFLLIVSVSFGVCENGYAVGKTAAKHKPYKYRRRGRRDPFRPLLTKQIINEEIRKKREAELAKAQAEREKEMAEKGGLSGMLGDLFGQQSVVKEPVVTFPAINIAGIMWDPYDPVLTLAENDRVFRKGDVIKDSDGDILIVDILPDSVIVEKSKKGYVKRKQIGIIRFEEAMQ